MMKKYYWLIIIILCILIGILLHSCHTLYTTKHVIHLHRIYPVDTIPPPTKLQIDSITVDTVSVNVDTILNRLKEDTTTVVPEEPDIYHTISNKK